MSLIFLEMLFFQEAVAPPLPHFHKLMYVPSFDFVAQKDKGVKRLDVVDAVERLTLI